MKIKFCIIVLIVLLLAGCSTAKETHTCVICGGEANRTLSGPMQQMAAYGISEDECSEITSGVYTAHVCEQCIGPVFDPAENVFNPFE